MSKKIERRLLNILMTGAILTTEDGDAGGNADDSGAGGDGGGNTDDSGNSDDLTALFTPEDIQAKKDAIAAGKAEEDRRAALTDEQRAEEDRVKAEAEAADKAPEAYADFKVPEGVVLDPEMMNEFAPIAKEMNLSQDKAQKLIDLASKMQQRTIDGIFAAHEQRKATWLEEAKNDKEIGEDIKLGPEKSETVRAFNSLVGSRPGIKAMVDELGIGNHPEFLRLFYDLSKKMREDTFVMPGGEGDAGSKTIAQSLWPGMK